MYIKIMIKYAIAVTKGELTLRRARLFFGRYYREFLEVYAYISKINTDIELLKRGTGPDPVIWAKAVNELTSDLKNFKTELEDLMKENPLGVSGKVGLGEYVMTIQETLYWKTQTRYKPSIAGHNEEIYGPGYLESLRTVTIEEGVKNFIKLEHTRPIMKEDPYTFKATNANMKKIAEYIMAARQNEHTTSGLIGIVLAQIMRGGK